jgi:hypothetical protein
MPGVLRGVRPALSPREVERVQAPARYPVDVTWPRPWDPEASNLQTHWRWCQGPAAEVGFENPLPERATIRVDFKAAVPRTDPVVLKITGLVERTLSFTSEAPCTLRFTLPPGRHTLRFQREGRP